MLPKMITSTLILAPTLLQREAWRALLSGQPDINVTGVIGDSAGLSQIPQPNIPATLLIDVAHPTPDLIHDLKLAAPHLSLLILVPAYELTAIIPLLKSGATGFVSLNDSVGDLARAIIAAGRSEVVLPPTIAARALTALAQDLTEKTKPLDRLSERELDILRLLAKGLTNKDIAQTLILSVRTVDAHLRSIFTKLGLRSRTEVALWAVKYGYGPRN